MTKENLKDIFDAMYIFKNEKMLAIGYVEFQPQDQTQHFVLRKYSSMLEITEDTKIYVKKYTGRKSKNFICYDIPRDDGNMFHIHAMLFFNKEDADQFVKYTSIRRIEEIFKNEYTN